MEGTDATAITEKTTALAQASMKLGEAMYQAGGGDAGEPGADDGATDGTASNEDVVDADFEEVDDDDQKKSA